MAGQQVFRKQTMERMSSPEQLSEYLTVSNPSMWVVLAGILILLVGLLAWSSVGVLETTEPASVLVEGNSANVVLLGSSTLQSGMTLSVAEEKTVISAVDADEYGRRIGHAELQLPNGSYEGSVVTDRTHPIQFLLESR